MLTLCSPIILSSVVIYLKQKIDATRRKLQLFGTRPSNLTAYTAILSSFLQVSFHKYKTNPTAPSHVSDAFPAFVPNCVAHPPCASSDGPFIRKPGLWKLSLTPSSPITKSSVFIISLSWIYLVIYLRCHHIPNYLSPTVTAWQSLDFQVYL